MTDIDAREWLRHHRADLLRDIANATTHRALEQIEAARGALMDDDLRRALQQRARALGAQA